MRANNVVKSLLLVSALRLCSASLAFTTETVNVWPEGRMPSVQTNHAYVLDESGLGKKERDELRRTGGELKFAPELAFDEKTPPMCLVHGDADGYTPMGSVAVYRELRRKGLPAELHVFAKTPHGFGIYKRLTPDMPAYGWPDRVYDWLAFMGFAKKGSAE